MENTDEIIKVITRMVKDTKEGINRMTQYYNKLITLLEFLKEAQAQQESGCIIRVEDVPEEELMKILAPLLCSKRVTVNGCKDIKGKLKGIHPQLKINLHNKSGHMLFNSLYNLFSKYNQEITYWLSELHKL